MSYQVLARKWRPQNFKQMVGQEHVLQALVHALESQRLHHAYLFTGTRGVGKTTIARILAKCLSCEQGITAEPCGQCAVCTAIGEGRYVDLIEIDAASRTKVEDMRELLDNVQYAPSQGKFKIYLIDEVHMLSASSFNALLKTLEEPPEHVKFLFATTDPQKLPVTILSRCLQFNLKNMSPERIVKHLAYILEQEQMRFEEPALWALARAADGSMRDALSLTDQAIAYGNQQLSEQGVSAMLGTVDHKQIYRILAALKGRDAAAMLNEVAALAEFSPDYREVLAALVALLHRVAVEQAVPGAIDNALGDQQEVRHYAGALTAEDVQLFYQIALTSRQDLAITPDPRSGFEMALLRMLAFQLEAPEQQTELAATPTLNDEADDTANSKGADETADAAAPAPAPPEPAAIEPAASTAAAPNQDAQIPAHAPAKSASTEAAEPNAAPNPSLETESPVATGQQDVAQHAPTQPAGEQSPPSEDAPPAGWQDMPPIDAYSEEVSAHSGHDEAASATEYADSYGDESKKKTALNEAVTASDVNAVATAPRAQASATSLDEMADSHGRHHDAVAVDQNVTASAQAASADADVSNTELAHAPSPQAASTSAHDTNAVSSATVAGPATTPNAESNVWPIRAASVAVSGMTQNLLLNMALEEQGDSLTLYVDSGHFRLLNDNHRQRIERALRENFGERASAGVHIVDGLGDHHETPMMWRERRRQEMQANAKALIMADPHVQTLIELFDARVVEESIESLGELH